MIKIFNDINEDVFQIRREVFIEEQGITEEDEFEGSEEKFIHFCLYDNNDITGYIRVYVENRELHIGRVAVVLTYRGRGLGYSLMNVAEEFGLQNNCYSCLLNSQIQAKGFYKRLGYSEVGEVFLEAGIDHIKMVKHLKSINEITIM